MNMFLISDNVDTATGMRLVGIEGIVVHEKDELKKAIVSVMNNKEVAILLINEKLARQFPAMIDEIKLTHKTPLIVEIPDRHGSGRSSDFISNYIKNAIGIKL